MRSIKWLACVFLSACRAPSVPSAPEIVPSSTPRQEQDVPAAWLDSEPVLAEALRACAASSFDERWEHRASRCERTRTVECASQTFDAPIVQDYCAHGKLGPVQSKRFKIETSHWCNDADQKIQTSWPFKSISFTRTLSTPCEAVEPEWVANDVARLRPFVGDSRPVASHWEHRLGGLGTMTREVEWPREVIDSSKLESLLDLHDYAQVTNQADVKQWSTRKPNTYSFILTEHGYREDRFIVGRWSSDRAEANPAGAR